MKYFYVYVLQSQKDNQFYIGYANDLNRRLAEHNNGRNISTAKRRPLELIFYEAYLDKVDAQRREKYLKTSKGKSVLKLMLTSYLSRARSSRG